MSSGIAKKNHWNMGVFKDRSGLVRVTAGGWHLSKAEKLWIVQNDLGCSFSRFNLSLSLSFFNM